jgi:hypothetical protein
VRRVVFGEITEIADGIDDDSHPSERDRIFSPTVTVDLKRRGKQVSGVQVAFEQRLRLQPNHRARQQDVESLVL